MDTEVSPQARPPGGVFSIFVTSFCAAIVLALGFGIVIEAFVVAAAGLFAVLLAGVVVFSLGAAPAPQR